MKTINELATELNLSEEQSQKLQEYVGALVIELLESIKSDNNKNFDETIDNLRN